MGKAGSESWSSCFSIAICCLQVASLLSAATSLAASTTSFVLDHRDSGLTVRGEAGARLLGGGIFTDWMPSTDPRLPEDARGKVVEVRLSDDFGTLRRRGFGMSTSPAPPPLFVDSVPQTLARWLNGLSERTVKRVRNTIAKDTAAVSLDPKSYTVSISGFVPIPFDRIGLYNDLYRRRLPFRTELSGGGTNP